MKQKQKKLLHRILIGGVLGALLAPVAVRFISSLLVPAEGEAMGSAWVGAALFVTPAMAQAFGSPLLALAVQSLLGAVFGAVVAVSTMPFADDGRELVLGSVGHFAGTALSFAALLWVCRWVEDPRFIEKNES